MGEEEKCCASVEAKAESEMALIHRDIKHLIEKSDEKFEAVIDKFDEKLKLRDAKLEYACEEIAKIDKKVNNGINERSIKNETKINNLQKMFWAGAVPILILTIKNAIEWFGK